MLPTLVTGVRSLAGSKSIWVYRARAKIKSTRVPGHISNKVHLSGPTWRQHCSRSNHSPWTIFHDHLLANALRSMLSHKTANDIECACGSKRRDETDRFVGVILGVGRRNSPSRSRMIGRYCGTWSLLMLLKKMSWLSFPARTIHLFLLLPTCASRSCSERLFLSLFSACSRGLPDLAWAPASSSLSPSGDRPPFE